MRESVGESLQYFVVLRWKGSLGNQLLQLYVLQTRMRSSIDSSIRSSYKYR